jgi:outer membrane cobalamin receptor
VCRKPAHKDARAPRFFRAGRSACQYILVVSLLLIPTLSRADITGRVLDPNGQPVPGAVVELLGGIHSQTRTDAAGRFRLASPPDGTYTLLASAPGFSGRAARAAVLGGAAELDLHLELAARRDVVVVTAERTEIPASAAASSITVISRAQLEEMHAENAGDALRHVPGLNVVESGSRGAQTSVFARGGNSNYNLVLVDGVPVNDFGGGFNFASLPVDTIERIEVVRGPQSALYGLNAIGSVIHIITRRPEDRLEAHASAEGGSFGAARGSFGAGARTGPLSWNLDMTRQSTNGVVPNGDYRNEAAALRLELETTRWSRLRYTFLADANEVGAPGPYSFAPVDRTTRGKENSYVNGLEFEWQRGRLRQKLTAGFYNDHTGYVSDFGPYDTRQFRGSAGAETSFSLTERHTLAFGVDYQREHFRNTFVTDQESAEFPVARTTLGWFLENRYERGGRFFLNTGLRLQSIGTAGMPSDAWGSRPPFDPHSVLALSPKVSAALLPGHTMATKLHASAGTGLRAPDGFELAFTNNGRLRPERTASFDAGVERQWLRRRLALDATYFFNRYYDLIVTLSGAFRTLSRFQSDNLANSRAQGIELSGSARPAEWLSLEGHYTWLKSAVRSLDGAPGQALSPFQVGQPLLRRPAHSGAYSAAWQVRRLHHLTLNTGAYLRSSVLDVHPLFGAGGGLFKNPGYISPEVGVEIALTREVSLFGRLYNFSDSRYEEALGFPALRRNFVAGLKFHWR